MILSSLFDIHVMLAIDMSNQFIESPSGESEQRDRSIES